MKEISEVHSINHVEEMKKSLSVVHRGGSLGWPGGAKPSDLVTEIKAALEEDFHHLLDQIDLIWKNREKMAAVRPHHRDAHTIALTNGFMYL